MSNTRQSVVTFWEAFCPVVSTCCFKVQYCISLYEHVCWKYTLGIVGANLPQESGNGQEKSPQTHHTLNKSCSNFHNTERCRPESIYSVHILVYRIVFYYSILLHEIILLFFTFISSALLCLLLPVVRAMNITESDSLSVHRLGQ